MSAPPCRLYVLVAMDAPVALIIRRGPADWWHLLRWDLERRVVEPGAWFGGMLYPRRCDISPDGRYFGYFALRNGRAPWDAFFAVSRTPWLSALAAWQTYGTYTIGCRFTRDGSLTISGAMQERPFHGRFPNKVAVEVGHTNWVRRDIQNELKRGWRPPREPLDLPLDPDEAAVVIQRTRPTGHGTALILAHTGVDFQRHSIEGVQVRYFRKDRDGRITPLPDAAWADWDHGGRLLLATREGRVAIHEQKTVQDRRKGTWTETWTHDLRDLEPAPAPAPDWAEGW
ncbi:hypothetical protein Acor_82150 [Acrocarpospora corrugata]|uniref:Uncharacterized protein n=1 Tax=Acrocarpospora corrugata TaxID=35763 RepID=A0A5M3WBF3_9ACTN|nr:hypothetical protein [Acrocarpospora corrugata]GES06146.1 hypothetical protein Acor_82150 [Acrocarpospora corrugata]